MRIITYGFIGLACLLVVGGGVMVVRDNFDSPRQVEPSPDSLRLPAALPAPELDAESPQESSARDLRTEMQVETSVLAALRDQMDQAKQEIADLQQQKNEARSALADLQRQQEAARAAPAPAPAPASAPAPQPYQQDPQRQPTQADSTPPPRTQATGDRVVTRHGANVRAAPNKDAAVQRTAPEGAVLQVYGRSRDGWVQVGEDGPWGWIYSSLLDRAP